MRKPITCVLIAIVFTGCIVQKNLTCVNVKDNEVILLKSKSGIAAVKVKDQSSSPEQMGYSWYLADKNGRFEGGKSGESLNASSIAFPGYKLGWSGASAGKGYVYFEDSPGGVVFPKSIQYCKIILNGKSINEIDPNNDKYKYRNQ